MWNSQRECEKCYSFDHDEYSCPYNRRDEYRDYHEDMDFIGYEEEAQYVPQANYPTYTNTSPHEDYGECYQPYSPYNYNEEFPPQAQQVQSQEEPTLYALLAQMVANQAQMVANHAQFQKDNQLMLQKMETFEQRFNELYERNLELERQLAWQASSSNVQEELQSSPDEEEEQVELYKVIELIVEGLKDPRHAHLSKNTKEPQQTLKETIPLFEDDEEVPKKRKGLNIPDKEKKHPPPKLDICGVDSSTDFFMPQLFFEGEEVRNEDILPILKVEVPSKKRRKRKRRRKRKGPRARRRAKKEKELSKVKDDIVGGNDNLAKSQHPKPPTKEKINGKSTQSMPIPKRGDPSLTPYKDVRNP